MTSPPPPVFLMKLPHRIPPRRFHYITSTPLPLSSPKTVHFIAPPSTPVSILLRTGIGFQTRKIEQEELAFFVRITPHCAPRLVTKKQSEEPVCTMHKYVYNIWRVYMYIHIEEKGENHFWQNTTTYCYYEILHNISNFSNNRFEYYLLLPIHVMKYVFWKMK